MKRKGKVVALIVAATITAPIAIKVNAANNYIPELNVYQQGSSPRIEIGIDMPDEDVIFTSDFKTNKPSLVWSGNGTQSFSTLDGRNVEMMTDSISGRKGNWFSYPQTDSDANYSCFNILKYPKDTWFSVSYETKALSSNNYIGFYARGEHKSRGVPLADDSSQHVYWVNNTTFKNKSKGDSFKVRLADGSAPNWKDGQTLCLVSSTNTNWGFYYIYFTYNKSTSSLVYDKMGSHAIYYDNDCHPDSATYSTFSAGSNVLVLDAYPVQSNFGTRHIPADGNWHRVSSNSIITCQDWDTNINGFKPAFIWSSDNNMYVSNMKFGKASKVQVMRDNSTTVYNDYGSEFTDTALVVKPNKPTISSQVTLSDRIKFSYSAQVKSETHNYKARSQSNTTGTWSSWSQNFPVTLTSTPSKYHITLYKNGTKVLDKDTGTSVEYTDIKRGDKITGQLYTIDTKGKWSSATAIDYTVGQTANDLKEDYGDFINSLTVDNNTDFNTISTQVTKLRTNTNIPYTVSNVSKTNATKYIKGVAKIAATINGQSQSAATPINCKPEYQTEQELKEDITDYLGQTSIHNSGKKIPDAFSYSKSKDADEIKQDLISKCKTNPGLKDISIEFNNTATEFKSGKLEGKIYLED